MCYDCQFLYQSASFVNHKQTSGQRERRGWRMKEWKAAELKYLWTHRGRSFPAS